MQWLKRQPQPIFKPGNTLPRQTRYGWGLSLESQKEFTEHWNYTLQTMYMTDKTVKRALTDPTSVEA